MNPVHGLPSSCHQRSPFHYIDSHTTQTVTCLSGLQFPSSIALITHSHLLTIRHALQALAFLVQIAEYCSAFITHLVIAVLWNHSVFPVLKFSLVLFIPELYSLSWIFLSPCHLDTLCPCLDYHHVFGLFLFVLPPRLYSPPIDPVCSLDCSCVLPVPCLFAGVSTLSVFFDHVSV